MGQQHWCLAVNAHSLSKNVKFGMIPITRKKAWFWLLCINFSQQQDLDKLVLPAVAATAMHIACTLSECVSIPNNHGLPAQHKTCYCCNKAPAEMLNIILQTVYGSLSLIDEVFHGKKPLLNSPMLKFIQWSGASKYGVTLIKLVTFLFFIFLFIFSFVVCSIK